MPSRATSAKISLLRAKKHHLSQKSGKKARPVLYTCEFFNAFFGFDAARSSKKLSRRPTRFMGINLLRIKDHEIALFPESVKLTMSEIPDCAGPYTKAELDALISEMHGSLPLDPSPE